jgi:hypothetical protein
MSFHLSYVKDLHWFDRPIVLLRTIRESVQDQYNIGLYVANETSVNNQWAIVYNCNVDDYRKIEDLLGMSLKMTRFQYSTDYESVQRSSPDVSILNRRLSCACLDRKRQMTNERRMSRVFEWSALTNSIQVFDQNSLSGHEMNNLTVQSTWLRRMSNAEYKSDVYNQSIQVLKSLHSANQILQHFRLCSIESITEPNVGFIIEPRVEFEDHLPQL